MAARRTLRTMGILVLWSGVQISTFPLYYTHMSPHLSISRTNLLSPDDPSIDTFRSPCNVQWLQGVALRDLALHERHGVCVDARGDVYQWGDAFFGSDTVEKRTPELTLVGKVCLKGNFGSDSAHVSRWRRTLSVYKQPRQMSLHCRLLEKFMRYHQPETPT